MTVMWGPAFWRDQYWGYDPLDDGIAFMGMRADDTSLTPVNYLETEEFKAAADLTKKWYDAGFFPKEPAPADEARAAFSAGLFAMGYHVEKPGNDVEMQAMHGFEFESKNLTDPLILDTAGATATLNGICATSKHGEAAMQVLELFNTDADIYNLLSHGIQGMHWVWEDEANKVMTFPEGVTAESSSYAPNTDWMFGNQFNAFYRDAAQVGAWEATKEMNDTAFPSEALGFVVDRQPIETEIAQTKAVWDEFVKPIYNGWVSFDENAPEALEKLNEAGAQVILDEVASQLQEWKASNE